jgi:ATP-dependent DNA helicase RecQ
VPAQKALSAVYRTGQRFGSGHVIDVLRGEETERVLSLDHHRVSTFGIGAEMDEKQWRSVFRQLLAAGLLEADAEGYGTLRLTAASRNVLRGGTPVRLREDARPERASRRRGRHQCHGVRLARRRAGGVMAPWAAAPPGVHPEGLRRLPRGSCSNK